MMMIKSQLCFSRAAVVAGLFLNIIVATASAADRVLHLNSYDPAMGWVRGSLPKFREVCNEHKARLSREHLNGKFYNKPEYLIAVAQQLKERYQSLQGDDRITLVVASDDIAYRLLAYEVTSGRSWRDEIFGPNVPVFFYGVNQWRRRTSTSQTPAERTANESLENWSQNDLPPPPAGFYGYFERPMIDENLQLIEESWPNHRVFVISDGLEDTGLAWGDYMRSRCKARGMLVKAVCKTDSLDALINQIKELPPKTVILLGAYFRDKYSTTESYTESTQQICEAAREATNGPIPVIGSLMMHMANTWSTDEKKQLDIIDKSDHALDFTWTESERTKMKLGEYRGAWGGYVIRGNGHIELTAEDMREFLGEKDPAKRQALLSLRKDPEIWPKDRYTVSLTNDNEDPALLFDYRQFDEKNTALLTSAVKKIHPGTTDSTLRALRLLGPSSFWANVEKAFKTETAYTVIGYFSYAALLLGITIWQPRVSYSILCALRKAPSVLSEDERIQKAIGVSSVVLLNILLLPVMLARRLLPRFWIAHYAKILDKQGPEGKGGMESRFRKFNGVGKLLARAPLAVPFADKESRYPGDDIDPSLQILSQSDRLQIVGRGGVGKSTLAFRIADSLLASQAWRLGVIPIPLTSGPAPSPSPEKVNATQYIISRCQNALSEWFGQEVVEEGFICSALKTGRIVLVIDGLSEMDFGFRTAFSEEIKQGKLPIKKLIFTHRASLEEANQSDLILTDSTLEVAPLYGGPEVTGFVQAFLTREWEESVVEDELTTGEFSRSSSTQEDDVEELVGDEEEEDEDDETKQDFPDTRRGRLLKLIVSAGASLAEINTFQVDALRKEAFTRLATNVAGQYFATSQYAKCSALFISLRLEALLMGRDSDSFEQLARTYIATLAQKVTKMRTSFPSAVALGDFAEKGISAFAHLALAILRKNDMALRNFQRGEALDIVGAESLYLLENQLGLITTSNESSDVLQFVCDPIAEYLAPAHLPELRDAERRAFFREFVEAMEACPQKDYSKRGVASSVVDYLRNNPMQGITKIQITKIIKKFQILLRTTKKARTKTT